MIFHHGLRRYGLGFTRPVPGLTHGITQHQSKPRALLLRKEKKTPLLWQALANKYYGQVEFGVHLDRKGKTAVSLGLEAGEKKVSKVLLYPAGSTNFVRYEGMHIYTLHFVSSF